MADFSNFKASLRIDRRTIAEYLEQISNPINAQAEVGSIALSDYNQTIPRPKFDKDVSEIIEMSRILNNLAPIKIAIPKLKVDETNGDRFYNDDGTLSFIREEENDIVRDYYPSESPLESGVEFDANYEIDKNTGKILLKVEPNKRQGSRLKTNITFLNNKINDKYILVQLNEDNYVNNITEFSGNGKYFKTLFRDPHDYRPVRYMEGRDDENGNFEMIDCIFDKIGNVARIKRYTNNREVSISYTDDTKNISVKNRNQ